MPFAAAAAATAVIGGSIIQGNKAAGAANAAAEQQREAGRLAAEYQKFRPVGVTTGFGKSTFKMGPYGVSEAGYELTPEMRAIRDKLITEAGGYDYGALERAAQPLMGAGQNAFALGGQYLSQSPEEARAEYMRTQQAALAPSREQQRSIIENRLQQTGRGGLAVGGTTDGSRGASNPELQAYYNAIAQQDLELSARAEQAAQQRQAYGIDLYNQGAGLLGRVPSLTTAGYGPLQTQLGLASTIEELGQQPLTLGLQVGGQNASAGANAGRSLLTSGMAAAQTQQAANSWSPWGTALQGAGQAYLGGKFGSFGGGGGGGSAPTYTGPSYGTNSSFDNSWFDTMSYD